MNLQGIICADCGAPTPRTGTYQRRCQACRANRTRDKQRLWARAHPRTPKQEAHARQMGNARARATGLAISAAVSRDSLIGDVPHNYGQGWASKFSFPFSWACSKNHIYSNGRGGSRYKRESAKEYETALALRVKTALRGQVVNQNKIWIDLFVQKPNHKGDAINMVDLVCDAIKKGAGVDDRWFCIRQLDWEITKNDPQIYITISQRDCFDAQACSYCGRILALSEFGTKRGNKNGFNRICFDCRRGNADVLPKAEGDNV